MGKKTAAEKFYYDLQASRLKENAIEQWKEYRNQVTNLLIQTCAQGKSLAIFGAGRCNDMDLGKLARHFGQITLIDLNESAMRSAIHQYGLEGHLGVKMERKDFVGITDEDYIKYVTIMKNEYRQRGYVLNEPASQTLLQLDCMYKKAKRYSLHFESNQYDYSLVLNVHSQLNDTADWIRTHMMSLLGEPVDDQNQVVTRIIHETAEIVKKFNDAVIAATKELAFIGYELGLEGQACKGVQGALQTYQDLRKREQCRTIKLMQRNLLTWPYDRRQQIIFNVLMETISTSH